MFNMRKTVMLMQDNMDCTEVMRLILEDEGYTVLCPEANQDITSLSDYDVLIIDEFSRGRTGGEVCRTLKNQRNKPVVLTSTDINLHTFSRIYNADVYLPKPFDIYRFTAIVKTLVHLNSGKHGVAVL